MHHCTLSIIYYCNELIYALINYKNQQLFLKCRYLGSVFKTLQKKETTSNIEEKDAFSMTPSFEVAKKLLYRQEQLSIYSTLLKEEYKNMYFVFSFFLKFGKNRDKLMKDLLTDGINNEKAKKKIDFINRNSN